MYSIVSSAAGWPALRLPRKAKVNLEDSTGKMDLEHFEEARYQLDTMNIPKGTSAYLSSSSTKSSIKSKDFSLLKALEKTPFANGINCSTIIRWFLGVFVDIKVLCLNHLIHRPHAERYEKLKYELIGDDDMACAFVSNFKDFRLEFRKLSNLQLRASLKKEIEGLLAAVASGDGGNPNLAFIHASIDWACCQVSAGHHVREYLKREVIVKHFWMHIVRDITAVFDLSNSEDVSKTVRINLRLVGELLGTEHEGTTRALSSLFGMNDQFLHLSDVNCCFFVYSCVRTGITTLLVFFSVGSKCDILWLSAKTISGNQSGVESMTSSVKVLFNCTMHFAAYKIEFSGSHIFWLNIIWRYFWKMLNDKLGWFENKYLDINFKNFIRAIRFRPLSLKSSWSSLPRVPILFQE